LFLFTSALLLSQCLGERVFQFLFGEQAVNDGEERFLFVVVQLFEELHFFHQRFVQGVDVLKEVFGNEQIGDFNRKSLGYFFDGGEIGVGFSVFS
jgi:hypothetical protein